MELVQLATGGRGVSYRSLVSNRDSDIHDVFVGDIAWN